MKAAGRKVYYTARIIIVDRAGTLRSLCTGDHSQAYHTLLKSEDGVVVEETNCRRKPCLPYFERKRLWEDIAKKINVLNVVVD